MTTFTMTYKQMVTVTYSHMTLSYTPFTSRLLIIEEMFDLFDMQDSNFIVVLDEAYREFITNYFSGLKALLVDLHADNLETQQYTYASNCAYLITLCDAALTNYTLTDKQFCEVKDFVQAINYEC